MEQSTMDSSLSKKKHSNQNWKTAQSIYQHGFIEKYIPKVNTGRAACVFFLIYRVKNKFKKKPHQMGSIKAKS